MAMEFRLPELGEGVYEAELVSWLVKVGDLVKRGQNLMEVLTDKATMEVPAPFAGKITALAAEPGSQIKVGDVVLSYAGADETAAAPTKATAGRSAARADKKAMAAEPAAAVPAAPPIRPQGGNGISSAAPRPGVPVKAAPSVRYLARKLGIELDRVRGTGPGGRILIEDLSKALPGDNQNQKAARAPAVSFDLGKPGTRVKLLGLRRKIAEHMVLSKRTIPHYSYVEECDATELVKLRAALRAAAERSGTRLTYLAFIVKAVVRALREVPIVNASLDEAAEEIVFHDRYHIGIAVAAPGGLIVPVVHDADQKDLFGIAREIDRLSSEARASKIRLEDLRGGTFTVTSIGSIGGLISTPVINHPQVGILGIGKIIKRPVYDERGAIRPADLLYLSFAFDHRVVDGAVGAVFGNAVLAQLQNPAALLLPG
jgi:pyruvate dehydrogenase E2 component (dihydrolipoamide acetyltransferase)/2-oxoisovalerate dehydrogenase E2 component (dihydrolipoyl transacylase)